MGAAAIYGKHYGSYYAATDHEALARSVQVQARRRCLLSAMRGVQPVLSVCFA